MTEGMELVIKERQEQIDKHGRSIVDDVLYNPHGELILGAGAILGIGNYPYNWAESFARHMETKSELEKRIISAALLVAEVDRYLYLQQVERERFIL